MIRWHDGDSGSSHDALTTVAVRAFLLGMLFGVARGLLAHRKPGEAIPAARSAPWDLRPLDDASREQTLDAEPLTVGRSR